MSSHFEFFGNTIIYPKIRISVIGSSGKKSTFEPSVVKWYFISSLFIGSYLGFRILRKIWAKAQKIYMGFKPLNLKNKNLAIVFGFGDSIASVKLTKALINLGFDLILINHKRTLENRRKSSVNKNDEIEEVDKTGFLLSYEEILEKPEVLKKKMGNDKIDFIFDFTDFTLINKSKIKKHNTEDKDDFLSEKFNFTLKEKSSSKKLNEKENFDGFFNKIKKAHTYTECFGNTEALKKLNKENLTGENSLILYSEEISRHINEIIFINENLIEFMKETKIIIFNYVDKSSDINHKLMVDYKNKFFNNLKNIPSKKKNFITYVKVINGVSSSSIKKFTEQDGMTIIRFSDMEDYEYSFV
jgi:hypothetical protein